MQKISKGLKNPIRKSDIYADEIELNHLKRIDKVFNKGIQYYLDPKEIKENKDASIFFRKKKFYSDLNFGSRKIVNQFENLKISLSTMSALSDMKIERQIKLYSVKDSPKVVAQTLRKLLYPGEFQSNLRDFLKSLIEKLAENNIFVFEFVETWNKKDKANIDGLFLSPNVIVLKRQQNAFRREIFTLAHELGHYLINEEEVEEINYKAFPEQDNNKVERWCNDFAYHFLAGKYSDVLSNIATADYKNDYHFELIEEISKQTHLSKLALFTRLLYTNKISQGNYKKVRNDLNEQYQARLEEEKRRKELLKEQGFKQRGSVPKPINSPLFVNVLQSAYYEGVINEYDFCKNLNIKAEKLNEYIS